MCDCAVALGPTTARGTTIFGKNSDREAEEPQPIRSLPAAQHRAGSRLRCTHIEVPQARETAAVLGTGPFWVWGLEQGVNEHGVAIGNESVFTHEELELPRTRLLGMDLVRLALERARSAAEARQVIAEHIESFGQGGRGFLNLDLAYSNGFLIADSTEAWSLQSSARRWAARRVTRIESLSNHASIGSDWDLLSPDAERYAIERGWWSEERGRLDFEAAYRSTRLVPRAFSDGRLRRSRQLLEQRQGRLTERDFFGLLRDHGEGSPLPQGRDPQQESYYTLCAHNDVQKDSNASMVLALDRPVRWFSLATPCTSVYLPLYLEGQVPESLQRAGAKAEDESAWWRFKQLQWHVEKDFESRLPRVRAAFDPLEQEWLDWAKEPDDPTARMQEATARALEVCDRLLTRL